MYLQEPSTPRPITKRPKTKTKGRDVDAQVAEFLAFEDLGCMNQPEGDSQQEKWLVILENCEQTPEDNIESWLTAREISRDSVDSKKYEYYDQKKAAVCGAFIDRSPINKGEDQPSPVSSPRGFHRFFAGSIIASRRIAFGTSFTYSTNGLAVEEELSLHEANTLCLAHDLDLRLADDQAGSSAETCAAKSQ